MLFLQPFQHVKGLYVIERRLGSTLRCGAKCFFVEFEMNGEIQSKPVVARTPVEARKTIRFTYGQEPRILSVKEEKKIRENEKK